jgi:NAD(P)H-dependent FMN reductase
MLHLKVIIGSIRAGRAADRLIPWLVRRLNDDSRFEAEILDLRDWPLPLFAESYASLGDLHDPTYSDPLVKSWNKTIAQGDGYLFVTPEYNHSVPAVLKNAIDSVFASFAFRNKPAATAAYSGGAIGGARAVEHLAHIAVEAELVPLRNTILIPYVQRAFDDVGQPTDPRLDKIADIVLDDLAWWAELLREARAAGTLPPAPLRLIATSPAAAS